MQTRLDPKIQQRDYAGTVDSILRKCVHCGFCNATCPTYQLLGDELDGPRGRIYQMKQFFEGEPANAEMLLHLDRCLTCRSCETTCPSGVRYSELLEIGREAIEQECGRTWNDRLQRRVLLWFLHSGWLFRLFLRLGQASAKFMPAGIRRKIPARQVGLPRSHESHARKILLLGGCVQGALTPNTNAMTQQVLNRLGIETIETPSRFCCGAAALHTSAGELGREQARRLIDYCWPHVEAGIEAIVVSATGCGVTIKDYPRLLAGDPRYAHKAETISSLFYDLVELIEQEQDRLPAVFPQVRRVAVHTPCTMQHGLGLASRVERILQSCGYEICQVTEGHLCCGSAGTYSILQEDLSAQLRGNKIRALTFDQPEIIATANVGCQLQISGDDAPPVVHWIELLRPSP